MHHIRMTIVAGALGLAVSTAPVYGQQQDSARRPPPPQRGQQPPANAAQQQQQQQPPQRGRGEPQRGQPPAQPPVQRGQPPTPPPVQRGQPPAQPPVQRGQPPTQPPVQRGQPPTPPPAQVQRGQPPTRPVQPPRGQPPVTPLRGQPPVSPPRGQPPVVPVVPPRGQPPVVPVAPPRGQPPTPPARPTPPTLQRQQPPVNPPQQPPARAAQPPARSIPPAPQPEVRAAQPLPPPPQPGHVSPQTEALIRQIHPAPSRAVPPGQARGDVRGERIPPQEQQRRVAQDRQFVSQYQANLDQRVRFMDEQSVRLQEQHRLALFRVEQAYLAGLQAQRERIRVGYNYDVDPFFYTPNIYRYNRGGVFFETNQYGVDILQRAVNYGYQEGVQAGQADRQDGWAPSYQSSYAYQDANYGYDGLYVSQIDYNYYFRQGFVKGYDDGYYGRRQYGAVSNGSLVVLGAVLAGILAVELIH